MDFIPNHHIDRYIVKVLTLNKSARYRDLIPAHVESNLFNYHRKVLIREGIIQRAADGRYELAPKGLRYVESVTITNMRVSQVPKVTVTYLLTNADSELAVWDKVVQPYIGSLNLPNGKIHFKDVSTDAGALRTLAELTTEVVDLEFIGVADVSVLRTNEQIVHSVHWLYRARIDPKLVINDKLYWITPEAVVEHPLAPWTNDMIDDFLHATPPCYKSYQYYE